MLENPGTRQILYYFSFVMVVLYLVLGFMFIFTDALLDVITRNRTIIGIFFIAYGVFRLFMLLRLKRSREKFENSEKQ